MMNVTFNCAPQNYKCVRDRFKIYTDTDKGKLSKTHTGGEKGERGGEGFPVPGQTNMQ